MVGWHGRAILVPGHSFQGKSTLVQAFVAAGALYFSDELALIDGAGQVHPYPRPMMLRDGTGVERRREVVPEEPASATTPLTAGYDRPSPLGDQLRWLRDAGFTARVAWSQGDLAVVAAQRN